MIENNGFQNGVNQVAQKKAKGAKRLILIAVLVVVLLSGLAIGGVFYLKSRDDGETREDTLGGTETVEILENEEENIIDPNRPEEAPIYSYTGVSGMTIAERFDETFPGLVVWDQYRQKVISVDGYGENDDKRWTLYLDDELSDTNPDTTETSDGQIIEWRLE